jgi:hypothetical protein
VELTAAHRKQGRNTEEEYYGNGLPSEAMGRAHWRGALSVANLGTAKHSLVGCRSARPLHHAYRW